MSFESAAEYLNPIAWTQYEDLGLSIYCKQQSLFAAHMINGYTGLPQQGQESFDISGECENEAQDYFFLLDASGSVWNVEYNLMVESIITLKDLNIGENRFAVANFADISTFDLIVPFTDDLADTIGIVRTLTGGTDVSDAFVQLKNYLSAESSKNAQNIILYTDAASTQFNTPPFDVYNDLKADPIHAEVYVIRYQEGFPTYDDNANRICAAIASKGGTWTGDIANNSSDPQGSGGPRKFLAEAFSGSIPILTENLTSCDTLTVSIPDQCEYPVIEWTSSDGGQILSDSIDVFTIVTNGVGRYTANITCKDGCTYIIDDGNTSNGLRIENVEIDYSRYRNGVKVLPHTFESIISSEDPLGNSKYGIYPNPVRETLYLSNLSNNMLIELFDVRGRKISSFNNEKNNLSIEVASFSDGIYFLKLFDLDNGNQESFKIVVAK